MRILFLILLPFFVSAQQFGTEVRTVPDGYDARTLHYYGNNVTSGDLDDAVSYNCGGIHHIILWSEVEPTDGGYDFSEFYTSCSSFVARGLWITFQLSTGPDAPITGVTDWLADLGVATFTTTGGNENGPYPDYYSALYETRLHALFDTLNKYIAANFTTAMKRAVLGQYVVLGSTGDTGPWKGDACTPANCLGYADDDTWKAWTREQVTYVQTSIFAEGLTHVSSYNEGNNHESFDYLGRNNPFGFVKNGDPTHGINNFGENIVTVNTKPKLIRRGEAQGAILGAPHAHRSGMRLVWTALVNQVDFFNMTGGWVNQVVEAGESEADHRMTNYFVKYAPHNDVTTATKAFIGLAQRFSFDDTVWFPPGATFGGNLTASGSTTAYNNRVTTAYTTYANDPIFRQWFLLDAIRDYINQDRVDSIVAYAERLGATYDPAPDDLNYGNPFGWGLLPNYDFHISQTDPNTTSAGVWLVGDDTSMHGEYARKFNTAGDPMSFDIDNKWAGGATTGSVKYTITFLNNNNGAWKLFARTSIGFSEVLSKTNDNSGKWEEETVTVANSVLGTATDFSLTYISGAKTTFSIIEIEKL